VPGIPQPLASYTPATRAGDLVFAAGHLASDFKQGVAPEARLDPAFPFYGSSIKKQTRYVLENLARRELKLKMPVEEQPGAKRKSCTHLEAFGRLRRLDLRYTDVTKAGAAKLRRPGLRVVTVD